MNSKKKEVSPEEIIPGNLYSMGIPLPPSIENIYQWHEQYQNMVALKKNDYEDRTLRGEWFFLNKEGKKLSFNFHNTWNSLNKEWLCQWSYGIKAAEENTNDNL
jgi:hypothetical protein